MGRRLRAFQRSSPLPAATGPSETPALSPSARLPEPVQVQEQPVCEPEEYPCPAYPDCTAVFLSEDAMTQHIRRHARCAKVMYGRH